MDYIILALALALVVALLMLKEYLNNKKYRQGMLEQLYEKYGQPSERAYKAEELSHIKFYYQKHEKEHQIDDITWNDLNMDRIYQQMNTSCSAAGDEYLYYCLRTPEYDTGKLQQWEQQITYFMEHEKERQAVQKELFALGRSGKYSIYEYLDNLELLGERSCGKYLFFDLLFLVSIGIMFLSLPLGVVLFIAVACHNLVGYYKEHKMVEPYVTSFYYVQRVLECVEQILKIPLTEHEKEQQSMQECYKKLKGFMRNSYLVIAAQRSTGNPLEILMDYLRMLFYLDLIQFNRTLASLRAHIGEVDEMITLLGKMETAIVIGSYRASLHNGWCVPDLTEDGGKDKQQLVLQDAYHPLLDNPVSNSIMVSGGVLLTGSNASGKSTFLRTMGICALLAQTVHTVPAKEYAAPIFRIYSSMALKDDIIRGDSYYMVEIKSIKRILDKAKKAEQENCKVLCFVDEVLRGTNTVERIAASTQILRTLERSNVICFAATHDVELTKLLQDGYENYHFEERIEQDDIFFPYQILAGPATSRNAIALLNLLGYDKEIVTKAEEMAENFLKEGAWRK